MFDPRSHFYPQFCSFIEAIAEKEPVLDLGTYRAFRKELAAFRHLFEKTCYFALDYRIRNDEDPAEFPSGQ